jgi:tetratricopeptide (TPR) repeat protein/ABC-type transporter Mla MlaB component
VFVARDRELGRLEGLFRDAMEGAPQVCFAVGEAGSGKSALVREFLRRAQEAESDLLVATAECNALAGAGDPYLPFREVLTALVGPAETAGDTDAAVGRLRRFAPRAREAILEFGPELVGLFVPFASLAAHGVKFLADKGNRKKRGSKDAPELPGELDQDRIFQQYTAVLQALLDRAPIAMFLDDLHWIDSASAGLLFHLSRTIQRGRLMIVGTYRPQEIGLGRGGERHPLEQVVNELARYRGDIAIRVGIDSDGSADADAGPEGRAFLDALIDSEPNRLGEPFRRKLFARTAGHALFTVELLRALQDDGRLVRDDGGTWIEGPDLDWERLPARVEGVIGERVARVPEDLRETLDVAAVAGLKFEGELVARVRERPERAILKELAAELDRRYQLIHEDGEVATAEAVLARYRFHHALIQEYLYGQLSGAERRMLHGDVATVLAELHAGEEHDIASQLARHYELAGRRLEASRWYAVVGRRAMAVGAFVEARDAFSRASDLAPEDELARAELLAETAEAQVELGDFTAAGRSAAASRDLARSANDERVSARALLVLSYVRYRAGGTPEDVRSLAAEALELAQGGTDPQLIARAGHRMATGLAMGGDFGAATEVEREVIEQWARLGDRRGEVRARQTLASWLGQMGERVAAREQMQEALEISREQGDRSTEGWCHANFAELWRDEDDGENARRHAESALELFQHAGARADVAWMLVVRGQAGLLTADTPMARTSFREALEEALAVDPPPPIEVAMALLGLAEIEFDTGEWERSARLFGAAPAHDSSEADWSIDRFGPIEEQLRRLLGEQDFEAAVSAGKVASLREILDEMSSSPDAAGDLGS